MNGDQDRSSARVLAWAISHAGQSETPTCSTLPARTWSSRARITSGSGVSVSRAWTQSTSTWSVSRRRRLASRECTRFFRWFPALFGSPGPVCNVYFVPSTNRSRRPFSARPTIVSEEPPVYTFAVSMKFPPASA